MISTVEWTNQVVEKGPEKISAWRLYHWFKMWFLSYTVKFQKYAPPNISPPNQLRKKPSVTSPLQIWAPLPPGACTWKIALKCKVKQSKNDKFTFNFKASPIDFEMQISLHRWAPPNISLSQNKPLKKGLWKICFQNFTVFQFRCFYICYFSFTFKLKVAGWFNCSSQQKSQLLMTAPQPFNFPETYPWQWRKIKAITLPVMFVEENGIN